MGKIIMHENQKYNIRETENNWLTLAEVKSMPIWKVSLILVFAVSFIIAMYVMNELLFLRDLKLFTTQLN